MNLKPVVGVAVASVLLALVACGSSADDKTFDDELNGSSGGTSGGASGGTSGFGGTSGTSGTSGTPQECAAQEAAASLSKKPVDIIFAIDNSGSMSGEIAEVEKQINDNFAAIIGASAIDYRVIMVAAHGSSGSQRICVKAPLSGTNCSPIPAQPVETAKFFHYNTVVGSHDSFCKLLNGFAAADVAGRHPTGWGALLRPGSFKVFVEITDDGVATSCGGKTYNDSDSVAGGTTAAADFDATLLALSPAHFGTAAARNYVWHSIVAVAPFNAADLTQAHPVTAPVITTMCTPGAADPGTGYQALSKLTGGLRYPTCGLNYTTIFKEMAKGVIDGAKVACEFDIPPPPAGETLDLTTVVPRYTPGTGGAPVDFGQVANAGACAPNKFYIEAGKIKLCPATCDVVQADTKAAIKVLFGCAPKGAN